MSAQEFADGGRGMQMMHLMLVGGGERGRLPAAVPLVGRKSIFPEVPALVRALISRIEGNSDTF